MYASINLEKEAERDGNNSHLRRRQTKRLRIKKGRKNASHSAKRSIDTFKHQEDHIRRLVLYKTIKFPFFTFRFVVYYIPSFACQDELWGRITKWRSPSSVMSLCLVLACISTTLITPSFATPELRKNSFYIVCIQKAVRAVRTYRKTSKKNRVHQKIVFMS
jgi:hypothetical protein